VKEYISVIPITEIKVDLLSLGEQRYTWFPSWDDLRSLNGKCLLDRFKIFLDQQDPSHFQPKLFVCMLIAAVNEHEANWKGTEATRTLANQLVTLFSRGFEVIEHEALIIDASLITKGISSLNMIELTILNGNVRTISSPHGKWTSNFPQGLAYSSDSCLSTFAKLQKIEGDTKDLCVPSIQMLQKEVLLNIDSNLRKMENAKPEHKKMLMNSITALYSAAITTSNVTISFLLLWQVLESLALIECQDEQAISSNTLEKIILLLSNEKYDLQTQRRVKSTLAMLTKKSNVDTIAEIVKREVFPNEEYATLRRDIDRFRRIRGAIAHPKGLSHEDTVNLLKSYQELRNIVQTLFKKLTVAIYWPPNSG
jgi:hypothetical protein